MCEYCNHPIEYDHPGWGYYFTPEGEIVRFHGECINICEGIAVGI